jgi:5,10-methylenetetrahydromethanopterin reductase
MIATTLDEVSNGRFNLGLSSGAADFLGWVGIEPHKPRTAVVETVEAVRQLMTGQSAAREGEFLTWSAEAHMRFSPFRRAPVYIGAMSSRMCAEIGRVADGGLPLLFPPEHYVQVIQWIEDGARQAGRSMSEIDVAACIWCSVSDNQAQAEDALKEKIAYYGHAMSATILEQLGLTHADFREIERLVMIEKNIEAAKRLVTEPMMRIGIAGSADKLIERLEQLAALGVQHISFGPPLGPDIDEAIRVIGQQIIPHFR